MRLSVLVVSLVGGWRLHEWVWLFVPGAQVHGGVPAIVATAVVTQVAAGLVLQALFPAPVEAER